MTVVALPTEVAGGLRCNTRWEHGCSKCGGYLSVLSVEEVRQLRLVCCHDDVLPCEQGVEGEDGWLSPFLWFLNFTIQVFVYLFAPLTQVHGAFQGWRAAGFL